MGFSRDAKVSKVFIFSLFFLFCFFFHYLSVFLSGKGFASIPDYQIGIENVVNGVSGSRKILENVDDFNSDQLTIENNAFNRETYFNQYGKECKTPLIAVLTTIFKPTKAVENLCRQGIPMIVISDRKSPKNYTVPKNCKLDYYDVDRQKKLEIEDSELGKFVKLMPWDHFGRKNIGFLLAVKQGACKVWDFDDDNWLITKLKDKIKGNDLIFNKQTIGIRPASHTPTLFPVVNPYTIFGPSNWYWPRGTPLEQVSVSERDSLNVEFVRVKATTYKKVAVYQASANGNPDVDGIFRQTQNFKIHFKSYLDHILMDNKVFCPYNAQATLHTSIGLWATYLPITVPGRVSDIWRSYFSQAIFKVLGYHIAFASSWVQHDRSAHDIIKDINAERDLRDLAGPLSKFLKKWAIKKEAIAGICSDELLLILYQDLYSRRVIKKEDVRAIKQWLKAMNESGMFFPCSPKKSKEKFSLSPVFPHKLDAHYGVHINSNFWQIIGLWQAMYSAQYKSVTFNLLNYDSVRQYRYSSFPWQTRFTPLSEQMTNRHVTGSLSYSTLLHTLRDAEVKSNNIVWGHDDLFVGYHAVKRWIDTEKEIVYGPFGGFLGPISSWRNSNWLNRWPSAISAAKMFISDNCNGYIPNYKCNSKNEKLFRGGASDFFFGKRSALSKNFYETLGEFSTRGFHLEIALSTAVYLEKTGKKFEEPNLLTWWDRNRDNIDLQSKYFKKNENTDSVHPVKLSSPFNLFKLIGMRDLSWNRAVKSKPNQTETM